MFRNPKVYRVAGLRAQASNRSISLPSLPPASASSEPEIPLGNPKYIQPLREGEEAYAMAFAVRGGTCTSIVLPNGKHGSLTPTALRQAATHIFVETSVASAVGEGSIAIAFVHQYLASDSSA
jgi:hypothetical protein